MGKKALVLIDYTYDFVADDGRLTAGKPAQAIDDAIASRVEAVLADGGLVFVANDLHFEGDATHPETALFPPHNIKSTFGRSVYGHTGETLKAHRSLKDTQIFYMDKLRYSAFNGTPLNSLLRQHGIDTVELVGVCTDICVLHTAVDAYNLGFGGVVRESCVATFVPGGQAWALNHFENSLGFDVIRV